MVQLYYSTMGVEKNRTVKRQLCLKLGLLIGSLVIALLLSEMLARLALPQPKGYYVNMPFEQATFYPDPEIMPGCNGPSTLAMNSYGFRSDERPREDHYAIIALGGSTTECLYLDQRETWTSLLQEKLSDDPSQEKAWVGNAARSGLNTREHRLQAQHFLPQFSEIDAVIMLVGVNDLWLRLSRDAAYVDHPEAHENIQERLINRAFLIHPWIGTANDGIWKQTALWRQLRKARWYLTRSQQRAQAQDDFSGKIYIKKRKKRQSSDPYLDKLPDLSTALDEYERNIVAIAEQVRQMGATLILVTQPSMWRANLEPDLEALLWGGEIEFGANKGKFYSVEALAQGLQSYNDRLRAIANSHNIQLIDLAPKLKKDSSNFYDGVHFNEQGARRVATVLAEQLALLRTQ